MHQLGLYFPVCNFDPKVMTLQDISIYDPALTISCASLKVVVPGIDCNYYPIFKVKGLTYLTSNSFNLTNSSCSAGLTDLPDGIYTFTYSICPNDEVIIVQKVLRDTVTRNRVLQELSNIVIPCESIFDRYGKDITSSRIQELKDLLIILDIAQIDTQVFKFTEAQEKVTFVNTFLNTL